MTIQDIFSLYTVVRPVFGTIMYMLLSRFAFKLLVLIGRLARTGVISLQQGIYRTLEVISISINIKLYMQHYTDSTVRDNTCHHACRLAHISAADVDTLQQYPHSAHTAALSGCCCCYS